MGISAAAVTLEIYQLRKSKGRRPDTRSAWNGILYRREIFKGLPHITNSKDDGVGQQWNLRWTIKGKSGDLVGGMRRVEGLRCERDDGYFTSKAVENLSLSFMEFEFYHSNYLLVVGRDGRKNVGRFGGFLTTEVICCQLDE